MASTDLHSSLITALVRHYDQLVAHVRRHVTRHGGDATQARDVVHDLCAQLIESPPITCARSPFAFLCSVAARRAIDRHRAEAVHAKYVLVTDTPPETHSSAADPARIISGRQQLDLLVRAIEALPERRREVFVLHKIHGLPQVEVANHLGISLKTVEKHLHLGIAACAATIGTS